MEYRQLGRSDVKGYYTGGVIEGALHYGVLDEPDGRASR